MSTRGTKRASSSLSEQGTPTPPSIRQRQPDAAAATAAKGAAASGRFAPACECVQLQDGTGKLRFWKALLTAAAQKRLFEELTLKPDLLPIPKTEHGGAGSGSNDSGGRGGGGVGGGSRVEAKVGAGGRWMQRPIKLFGKEVLQPRLTCFYGQEGLSYRYSGKTLEATPWDGVPAIQEILAAVEAAASLGPGFFNCVLLNWYRDGKDNMGWHSDDERDLEKGASIASVSLGAGRRFQLRRKTYNTQKWEFVLGEGSLLLMEGSTQEHWQHRVPQRTAKEEREIKQEQGAAAPKAAGQTSLDAFFTGGSGKQAGNGKGDRKGDSKGGKGGGGGGGVARVNLTFRRIAVKPSSPSL